jgi:hypothetical protein
MAELDQLIKMANQIAANFSFHKDVEDRIADHLKRFWAPQMRQKLADHVAGSVSESSSDVVPEVISALGKIHDHA